MGTFEAVEGDPFTPNQATPQQADDGQVRPQVMIYANPPAGGGPRIEAVEGDPFAKTLAKMQDEVPVTAKGLAKGFGVGAAEGAIGIPGMVGDTQEAGKSATEALGNYLPPFPFPDTSGLREELSKFFDSKQPKIQIRYVRRAR